MTNRSRIVRAWRQIVFTGAAAYFVFIREEPTTEQAVYWTQYLNKTT